MKFNIVNKEDLYRLVMLWNKGYSTTTKVINLAMLSNKSFVVSIDEQNKSIVSDREGGDKRFPQLSQVNEREDYERYVQTENANIDKKNMFRTFT